jgi:hypothetical protein
MNIYDFEDLADNTPGLPIPATSANIRLARKFVRDKWMERSIELGKTVIPHDLSDSCKFTSQFARFIFGGELEGNVDHQYVRLDNGKILDLNASADDVQHRIEHPHVHDPEFFGNPEHEESMESCRGRVLQWVDEFIRLLRTPKAPPKRTKVPEGFRMDLREADSKKPGQFVGVKFSPETVQNLIEWSKQNDIVPDDPSKYHTTVILSKTRKFKYDPIRWEPPLIVDPTSFQLELFENKNTGRDELLVLTYDCAELDARHWLARTTDQLSWEWPDYTPHITLSPYGTVFTGDLSTLPKPSFNLEIVSEYVKDFD